MNIIRGDQTFELTPAEIRKIGTELWHSCVEEDIKLYAEENLLLNINDIKLPTADYVDKILSKNDAYFDAYWQSIDYAIHECNEE